MDRILLVRDLNPARRSLRVAVREFVESEGRAPNRIPHSFHSEELIAFAAKTLRRRDAAQSPLQGAIATGLSRVQSILGQYEDAAASLDRWRTRETDPESTARQAILNAELVLIPEFRYDEAFTSLHGVIRTVGLSRHLRAHAWLLSARCASRLGDTRQSAACYREVLSSAIPSVAPLAEIGLASIFSRDRHHGEAFDLSSRAIAGTDHHAHPHAWRTVLGNRASILLRAARDYRDPRPYVSEAEKHLADVLADSCRVLDKTHTGLSYNTFGALYAQGGRWKEAQAAYIEAIRFLDPSDERRFSSTFRGLSTALRHLGQPELALAALEVSLEFAQKAASEDLELKTLTLILKTLNDRDGVDDAIRSSVLRARSLTHGTDRDGPIDRISQQSALEFARVLSDLSVSGKLSAIADDDGGASRIAGGAAHDSLSRLVYGTRARSWETLLREKLGEGIPIKAAPESERLVPFLMSYSGDTMRINQYLSEFDLKLSQAKTHLRHLCSIGVLEIEGVRKAARYFLAFHRPSSGGGSLATRESP